MRLIVFTAILSAVSCLHGEIVFEDNFEITGTNTALNPAKGWVESAGMLTSSGGVDGSTHVNIRGGREIAKYYDLTTPTALYGDIVQIRFDAWYEDTNLESSPPLNWGTVEFTSNGTWHIAATYDSTNHTTWASPGYGGPYMVELDVSGWSGGDLSGFAFMFEGQSNKNGDRFRIDNVQLCVTNDTPLPGSPPLATNDTYSVDEDDVLTVPAPGILANDNDADGDPLTVDPRNLTKYGALSLNTNGSFTYTPEPDFFGTDEFTYRLWDGVRFGNVATVSITVNNVPDAPVAISNTYAMAAGTSLNVPAPGVLGNDSDADGDPLVAEHVTDPANGSVVLTSNGAFVYSPNPGFLGLDSFEYRVAGGNTATVSITVAEPKALIKPNILLFFADDMGFGDTQVYNPNTHADGCPVDMPHIEKLASEGMRFTDAHTPQALCAPNRYSILSGNYLWRGRAGWGIDDGPAIQPDQESLPTMLKKAGYRTAMVGKGHIGGLMPLATETLYGPADTTHPAADPMVPLKYDWTQSLQYGAAYNGFDYAFVAQGGIQDAPYAYLENDRLWGDRNEMVHFSGATYETTNGTSTVYGYRQGDGMPYWHSCDVGPMFTRKTLEFIDLHHQQNLADGTTDPFFIYYCAEAVHVPHTPPKSFLGEPVEGVTGFSDHADMLYELDVALGFMLDALEERGLIENTLIIFTSDNGGLKNYEFSTWPLRGYKAQSWEGGHRVPLIVKWGDGTPEGSHIPPNTVRDQMVNVMDIYTTLAEIVGVDVVTTQAFDSVSMRSIWLEGSTNEIRQIMTGSGGGQSFIRDGLWKYVTEGGNPSTQPESLFHLGNDLGEANNLIDDPAHTNRAAAMRDQLNTILTYDATDTRTTPVPAPVPDPALLVDADNDGMEDNWERRYFASTNAFNGGSLDDLDRDGLANLFEFAVGGHPGTVIADDVLPTIGTSAGDVTYIFNRRTNAAALNLLYDVEVSDNLVSNDWNTVGTVEAGSEGFGDGLETVTNQLPTLGKTNQFIRLRVTHETF